jgi:hypothetical protein
MIIIPVLSIDIFNQLINSIILSVISLVEISLVKLVLLTQQCTVNTILGYCLEDMSSKRFIITSLKNQYQSLRIPFLYLFNFKTKNKEYNFDFKNNFVNKNI